MSMWCECEKERENTERIILMEINHFPKLIFVQKFPCNVLYWIWCVSCFVHEFQLWLNERIVWWWEWASGNERMGGGLTDLSILKRSNEETRLMFVQADRTEKAGMADKVRQTNKQTWTKQFTYMSETWMHAWLIFLWIIVVKWLSFL